MKKSVRYSPEVMERAVRMVQEAGSDYESQWAAITSIAAKIGCTSETLRRWVRQRERDTGQREGTTTAESERLKALERENKELRKANEILRLASAFFAQAELDRRFKSCERSSTSTAKRMGSSRFAKSCRSPRPATGVTPRSGAIRLCDVRAPRVTTFWPCKSSASGKPICRFMVQKRSGASCVAKASRPPVAPSSV